MKLLSKYIFSALFLAASGGSATAQSMRANTYCNPLNVDYTYMIYNSSNNLSYRSGADPAVVEFRGEYYMFVTRSHGYWHSKDLLNWDFITPGKNWYPQGSNAPAAHNYKDSVLYVPVYPITAPRSTTQLRIVVINPALQPANPFSLDKTEPTRPDFNVCVPLLSVTWSITIQLPDKPTPWQLLTSP